MTDREIVALYEKRDPSAVEQSARIYGGYCLAIAQRILTNREDAEECVNDTWMRAWQVIPPQRPLKLSSFFGRITRNLSLDRYAAAHAAKRGGGQVDAALDELSQCISAQSSTEQEFSARELERCINSFLRTISERDRAVFLCRYWHMLSISDIAKRFGIKAGGVKVSLCRTRARLKAFLEKEDMI